MDGGPKEMGKNPSGLALYSMFIGRDASLFLTILKYQIWFTTVLAFEPMRIWTCPPEEAIAPFCNCTIGEIQYWMAHKVYCRGILQTQELKSVMRLISDYYIDYLRLDQVYLTHLPTKMFNGGTEVEFEITNSTIFGWLPEEHGWPLFDGVQLSMGTIKIDTVEGLSGWTWTDFKVLESLRFFRIRNSNLDTITTNVVKSLKGDLLQELYLENCNIHHLDDDIFNHLPHLHNLSLAWNSIKEVKRSMFRRPAEKLRNLLLNNNKISVLPEDLFVDMPALVNVTFAENKIMFLSYETFEPTRNLQWHLNLTGNPLFCCADLDWIVTTRMKEAVEGSCYKPNFLGGKPIKNLTVVDLDHDLC